MKLNCLLLLSVLLGVASSKVVKRDTLQVPNTNNYAVTGQSSSLTTATAKGSNQGQYNGNNFYSFYKYMYQQYMYMQYYQYLTQYYPQYVQQMFNNQQPQQQPQQPPPHQPHPHQSSQNSPYNNPRYPTYPLIAPGVALPANTS